MSTDDFELDVELLVEANHAIRSEEHAKKMVNYRKAKKAQFKQLKESVESLEKLKEQLETKSRDRQRGILPWKEVAKALEEHRKLSETQNKELQGQLSHHKALLQQLYQWVAACVVKKSPDAACSTWRNVTLLASPDSRRLGKEWITKQMYYNTDRVFFQHGLPAIDSDEVMPCELLFPITDGVCTTVYRHVVFSNIPFDYVSMFPMQGFISSFMPPGNSVVSTILDEIDDKTTQCAVVSQRNEYVNMLCGKFLTKDRCTFVLQQIQDDEICPTKHLRQRNRLFWIDIHRQPNGRTKNRVLFLTSASFTKNGYATLEEDAQDWGFDLDGCQEQQKEAHFVQKMRRAVSQQHRMSACPHCTLA